MHLVKEALDSLRDHHNSYQTWKITTHPTQTHPYLAWVDPCRSSWIDINILTLLTSMDSHRVESIASSRSSPAPHSVYPNWPTSTSLATYTAETLPGHRVRVPCVLCGNPRCGLRTHRAYITQLRQQGFRAHDISRLLSSPFTSSYAYNPLSVAIDHVQKKLHLDIDAYGLGDNRSLPAALNKLISYDVECNTPFTDPAGNAIGEVAAEWLAASSTDEIACASTLNLWLRLECANTNNPGLEQCSSKLTSFFLEELRERVEGGKDITAGTIFAASNHFNTCLIFHDLQESELEIMMNGLEAMVNSQQGLGNLLASNRYGLFQNILWNDVLYCAMSGARPRFRVKSPPAMPYSLAVDWSVSISLPSIYENFCSTEILDVARNLQMFLHFRYGSEMRPLKKIEYQYLVSLERFVNVKVFDQAARYHDTGTINECVILTISLIRMSVLCIWEPLIVCRKRYVERLEKVLRRVTYREWTESGAIPALIWSCYVILAQSQIKCDTELIMTLLTFGLKSKMGWDMRTWPENWEDELANEMQPLLWHSDYDAHLSVVADLVVQFDRGPLP